MYTAPESRGGWWSWNQEGNSTTITREEFENGLRLGEFEAIPLEPAWRDEHGLPPLCDGPHTIVNGVCVVCSYPNRLEIAKRARQAIYRWHHRYQPSN